MKLDKLFRHKINNFFYFEKFMLRTLLFLIIIYFFLGCNNNLKINKNDDIIQKCDPISSQIDYGADGNINVNINFSYIISENEKIIEMDLNNDGIPDKIYTSSYDSHGNIIKEERDGDGDPSTPNLVRIHIFTYDSNGNILEEKYDLRNDGIIDEIIFYYYNVTGKIIRKETDSVYSVGIIDGIIDSIYYFEYDSKENLEKLNSDFNADGTINRIETNFHDISGNIVKKEVDSNSDGTVNDIYTYTYNCQP